MNVVTPRGLRRGVMQPWSEPHDVPFTKDAVYPFPADYYARRTPRGERQLKCLVCDRVLLERGWEAHVETYHHRAGVFARDARRRGLRLLGPFAPESSRYEEWRVEAWMDLLLRGRVRIELLPTRTAFGRRRPGKAPDRRAVWVPFWAYKLLDGSGYEREERPDMVGGPLVTLLRWGSRDDETGAALLALAKLVNGPDEYRQKVVELYESIHLIPAGRKKRFGRLARVRSRN